MPRRGAPRIAGPNRRVWWRSRGIPPVAVLSKTACNLPLDRLPARSAHRFEFPPTLYRSNDRLRGRPCAQDNRDRVQEERVPFRAERRRRGAPDQQERVDDEALLGESTESRAELAARDDAPGEPHRPLEFGGVDTRVSTYRSPNPRPLRSTALRPSPAHMRFSVAAARSTRFSVDTGAAARHTAISTRRRSTEFRHGLHPLRRSPGRSP